MKKKVDCGFAVINKLGSPMGFRLQKAEAEDFRKVCDSWAGNHPPHFTVKLFYEADAPELKIINSKITE